MVHVDFQGGRAKPDLIDEPALSSTELAGLRKVFKVCPLARRALSEDL